MAIIYFNVPGSPGGGGPSVFVYKTAAALNKLGHKVIYDKPQRADATICIIESGKTLKRVNRSKTKVGVRIDGAYFKEYWDGSPGRKWRPDMTALHEAIKRDVREVDVMIYQSNFSKDMIDKEIAKRDDKFVIINNGVDISLFRPMDLTKHGEISLFHIGKMRNGYIMEMLVGCYTELKKRGHNVRLTIAGNMDAECAKVFAQHKADPMIKHLGSAPNNKLSPVFGLGDIYLGPRQGSSCDNVIAEAQACGLPVVIPTWGGNKDMVVDGSTGVVVESGKWDYDEAYINSMADGVEKILEDLDGFKARARKHAIDNLNIDTMVKKYLKAFGI